MEFKNRRGAFVVLIAILFLAMIGVSAVAIDFSRMWALRNYLQTSADAGAMGGALQLIGRNRTLADSAARAWADSNKAFGRSVIVDSVLLGRWNDSTRTFALGAVPNDAVTVVVADTARGLLMRAFGIAPPRLRTRAVGWAGAGITTTSCMKPWAVPYESLMYAINLQRGISPAASNANLTRAFDNVLDIQALNSMTAAQRTFTLKHGSGGVTAPAGGYTAANLPGNYQAVDLPIAWKSSAGPYNPYGSPASGASAYRNNISGTTCNTVSVGDSLDTEPGNMVGPTTQGITPAVCVTISVNDDCLDAAGNVTVTVKAAFFSCYTGCNGKTRVKVDLLGSFTLTKYYANNSGGHSKAEITGIFNPVQASGPVGSGPTTLFKPILVK